MSRTSIKLAVALVMVAVTAFGGMTTFSRPRVASAHPLGNFTVNRYSRIEPMTNVVRVRYVLDMAEIPAFQEMESIDVNQNGQVDEKERVAYLQVRSSELVRALQLEVDGKAAPLSVSTQELSFPPGQGGLSTLRLTLNLEAVAAGGQGQQRLFYRDDTFGDRLGWKEIIVRPGEGVSLVDSTVPQRDRSDELRNYPQDLLNSPPDVREARVTFVVGGIAEGTTDAETAVEVKVAEPQGKQQDMLTKLISSGSLSLPVVVLAFMLALGLGALHALSPGHGKTVMAAYLIGTRWTARHALFLAGTVTVTHTLGVLGVGMVVLFASHLLAPEDVYRWLGLASGVLILGIGVWLLTTRMRGRLHGAQQHTHSHEHGHEHPHEHRHSHAAPGGRLTWRNLAALGIADGLVPSASALIILLAAISLDRLGLGIALILAFSVGMASVLAGIGLVMVYARRVTERLQARSPWSARATAALPVATALVVLAVGGVMTLRAVLQVVG